MTRATSTTPRRRGVLALAVIALLAILAIVGFRWRGAGAPAGRAPHGVAPTPRWSPPAGLAERTALILRGRSAQGAGADDAGFELREAAPIAGIVIDGEGRPVAGATLELLETNRTGRPVQRTTSGDDGAFELGPQPVEHAYAVYRVVARKGDLVGVTAINLLAERGERVVVRIAACPERVRLRVVDAAGAPIPSATVSAEAGMAIGAREIVPVDARGEAELCRIEPEQLVARAPGFPGDDAAEALIVLPRCRLLAGRVERDGRPVAGVMIEGQRTLEDGGFVLDCVLPGATTLAVAGLEVVAGGEVAAGTDDRIDLVVEIRGATGVVHGRVTRAGQPAAAVEVVAAGVGRRTRTDGEGRYRLDGLPVGEIRLSATDREAEQSSMPATVAVAADREAALDLELSHRGELVGRVVDSAACRRSASTSASISRSRAARRARATRAARPTRAAGSRSVACRPATTSPARSASSSAPCPP